MAHYLLDACALLAFLNGEAGKQMVIDLLKQARNGEIRLSMSIVQLLEVYYDCIYVAGEEDARTTIKSILSEPISIIENISYRDMYEAGRFKTSYMMSLADSFAAAIAKNLSATIVTKDNEVKAPEKAGEFSVLWLE